MNSILTVSQLNRYISFKLKEDIRLKGVLVRGEISGFTDHRRTGHFYFTLKDKEAAVKAVMFNSFASRLKFIPQNGMSVIVMGSIGVFERDGAYQLYATDIQPEGIGAAYLAAEQLKQRLLSEGIFDPAHKKPIPPIPERVGIVTAKNAAALSDILNIIGRRFPLCETVLFDCAVQGEGAEASICRALSLADRSGCSVIICGRGGGSAEELSAFNGEMLARTLYAMNTPVISAVGHETDNTIADLAADLRAPTPSAAAELAVPDLSSLSDIALGYESSLSAAFSAYIMKKRQQLLISEARLREYYPIAALARAGERIAALQKRLSAASDGYFGRKRLEIAKRASELDALSPLRIMSRGYSLVYKDGMLITSADKLTAGDRISVRLSDGEINADVV